MNLFLLCEETNTNAMYGCITPSLGENQILDKQNRNSAVANLIIEAAFFIQKVEEFHIRLPSPKVKIANFEVTPD